MQTVVKGDEWKSTVPEIMRLACTDEADQGGGQKSTYKLFLEVLQ